MIKNIRCFILLIIDLLHERELKMNPNDYTIKNHMRLLFD